MNGRTLHEVWDVDLLVGRDPTTGTRVAPDNVASWQREHAVTGGILGSQRALTFDVASGNAEAAHAAAELGLVPSLCLETRDWLGARAALAGAPDGTVVRLAPQRQDCQPTHPGYRAIVDAACERGFLILTEGDVRVWGPPLAGRGASAVFLDAHFYQLGDIVALFDSEPGFHASTRLLNGPDSLTLLRDELGIERLVFGSRQGFHEGASALTRVVTSTLSDDDLAAVAAGNLRRLLGRTA